MKKLLIITVSLLMTPLICSGESYFDTLNSPSPDPDRMTQRAQDIISESQKIVTRQQCVNDWKQDPCVES